MTLKLFYPIEVAMVLTLISNMMIYSNIVFNIVCCTDDSVIFGTDEKEFLKNLDMFFEYSELWHLNINYDKIRL